MLTRLVRLSCGRVGKCLKSDSRRCFASDTDVGSTAADEDIGDEPWKDPWKYAIKRKGSAINICIIGIVISRLTFAEKTLTSFEEANVDWKYVERLMPHKVIPDIPEHSQYPTPSGWRPPNPSPDLPYYVGRRRTHTLPLFLERRRDQLDPKTMEFEYVEIVALRNVHGDIFACERDLREYLENELKHPVATNVDELKGIIRVKGADRTLLEKFLFDCGF
ncbi:unnamed protein product [Anisakis simplex]|uniref:Large ribosomal subunit protein mL49 n=1 Tax=Anisakis simplex TaxID=6269 RepID=A0A0M3IZN7_ANISI|nr:unnamed protein product [Anisakis simplex]